MCRDDAADPPAIVCQVGGTQLMYDARAIDDLHAMLKAHGDWVPLGGADEQKPAPEGTVEAWGRSTDNPRRRLVRPEEGPARPVRRVHAAAPRGARPRRGHPRRQEQPDAGHLTAAGDADAFAATGRRSVRRARRPEPPGDRRAARRRRAVRPGARRRAADQPAGRLAPPAAAEGGRARRRGAARDAADLPAPRRGRRGRPGLPRAGLGRGRRAVPAGRREHTPAPRRPR